MDLYGLRVCPHIHHLERRGLAHGRHDADQVLPEQRLRPYWGTLAIQIRGRQLGAWPPGRLGDAGSDH